MESPRPANIQTIVERYQSGDLFNDEDIELYEAAEKLEHARRHYFDGLTVHDLSQNEYEEAQGQREQLREIANSIWRLLIKRYGCND